MSHDLVSGSDRALALQSTIQQRLADKGYSTIDDPVMAEYITIMLINSKTPDQITSELQDLIGDDYDDEFTNWLFAAKANSAVSGPKPAEPAVLAEQPISTPVAQPLVSPPQEDPTHRFSGDRSRSNQSRPLINQALSSIPLSGSHSSTSPSSLQKRSASARSPSPSTSGPAAKRRHADLPDRPRAMRDENPPVNNGAPNANRLNRLSLIDRVGPAANLRNGPPGPIPPADRVQAQIDAVTNSTNFPHPHHRPTPQQMHPQPPFNGFAPPMMMNGMMPGMMTPQDLMHGMMEAQMAMAQFGQMAVQMGLVPGVTLENNEFKAGPASASPSDAPDSVNGLKGQQRGFAGDRGRRGRGALQGSSSRGRGGSTGSISARPESQSRTPAPLSSIAAPEPPTAISQTTLVHPTPTQPSAPVTFNVPIRPLSPTLCKFSTSCTNAHCRYSHPSPAATPESGVVLSMEPCAKGLDCEDKDCKFAHVSKAAKGAASSLTSHSSTAPPTASKVLCKFNPHCTRPGCAFLHLTPGSKNQSSTPCRFGASCTRADCPYGHPAGRVLPSSFSHGLGGAAPTAIKSTSDGFANRSVDFRTRAKGSHSDADSKGAPSVAPPPLSKDAPVFVPKGIAPNSGSSAPLASKESKTSDVSNEPVVVV